MTTRELASVTEQYYAAWEAKDRAAILRAVTPDLQFRSPADDFDGATAFLEACFGMFGGMAFDFTSKLYGDDEAFLAYQMAGPDGPMPIAEHLRFEGGKIAAVRVYFGQKLPSADR